MCVGVWVGLVGGGLVGRASRDKSTHASQPYPLFHPHTIHAALMYKQNFEEILESVQAQILQHFDVGERELEEATEAFKDDPEVAGLVAELEGLYLGGC